MSRKVSFPTDPVSLCRTDAPPPTVHVFLVDATDELSDGEATQIANELDRLRNEVPRFGRVEIYALDRASSDYGAPRLSICNPGQGKEMSAIYQNPELAEKKWQKEFRDRMNQVIFDASVHGGTDRSLIMEAIRAISINTFSRPIHDSAKKQLTIFSDLLQHVPETYSHYPAPLAPYHQFRNTRYSETVRADLRNVEIAIFYIHRPGTARLQGRQHIEFWMGYFNETQGDLIQIKRLLGD